MRNLISRAKTKKGVVLLTTLVIIVTLLLLGTIALYSFLMEISLSLKDYEEKKDFWLAEASLERMYMYLDSNNNVLNVQNVSSGSTVTLLGSALVGLNWVLGIDNDTYVTEISTKVDRIFEPIVIRGGIDTNSDGVPDASVSEVKYAKRNPFRYALAGCGHQPGSADVGDITLSGEDGWLLESWVKIYGPVAANGQISKGDMTLIDGEEENVAALAEPLFAETVVRDTDGDGDIDSDGDGSPEVVQRNLNNDFDGGGAPIINILNDINGDGEAVADANGDGSITRVDTYQLDGGGSPVLDGDGDPIPFPNLVAAFDQDNLNGNYVIPDVDHNSDGEKVGDRNSDGEVTRIDTYQLDGGGNPVLDGDGDPIPDADLVAAFDQDLEAYLASSPADKNIIHCDNEITEKDGFIYYYTKTLDSNPGLDQHYDGQVPPATLDIGYNEYAGTKETSYYDEDNYNEDFDGDGVDDGVRFGPLGIALPSIGTGVDIVFVKGNAGFNFDATWWGGGASDLTIVAAGDFEFMWPLNGNDDRMTIIAFGDVQTTSIAGLIGNMNTIIYARGSFDAYRGGTLKGSIVGGEVLTVQTEMTWSTDRQIKYIQNVVGGGIATPSLNFALGLPKFPNYCDDKPGNIMSWE